MDNKYGRVFTQGDVEKIFEWIVAQGEGQPLNLGMTLESMDDEGVRFKWNANEPIFVLRGQDRTAEAAIRFYREHQRPSAPPDHLDAIDSAVDSFREFRTNNPQLVRDPD
jgi:hypothetical protein